MSSIAVERALILLRYIMENEDGLSIREVSRQLGFSPATVQKLINALKSQGYVVQDSLTERYHLGPGAVNLGLTALSRLKVRQIARSHLEKLCQESGETVFLAIARGDHVVYVDKVVSDQPIRMDAPLGADRPYNCTAVGKVLLADLMEEDIRILAEEGIFEKRTENSIIDVDELLREIGKIQEKGWGVDNREFDMSAQCVAAPIYNYDDEIVAAVTISGPADRIDSKKDALITFVKSTAQNISKELGYTAK
jgi:DNA-binding IclR family transcriptional regulator